MAKALNQHSFAGCRKCKEQPGYAEDQAVRQRVLRRWRAPVEAHQAPCKGQVGAVLWPNLAPKEVIPVCHFFTALLWELR